MSTKNQRLEIDEIFLEAIELPSEERAAFLDKRCKNLNAQIRIEVEELLTEDEGSSLPNLWKENPDLALANVLRSDEFNGSAEDVGSNVGNSDGSWEGISLGCVEGTAAGSEWALD